MYKFRPNSKYVLLLALFFGFAIDQNVFAMATSEKNQFTNDPYIGWKKYRQLSSDNEFLFELRTPPFFSYYNECYDQEEKKVDVSGDIVSCPTQNGDYIMYGTTTINGHKRSLEISVKGHASMKALPKEKVSYPDRLRKRWERDLVSFKEIKIGVHPAYLLELDRKNETDYFKFARFIFFEYKRKRGFIGIIESAVEGQYENGRPRSKALPTKDWLLNDYIEKIIASIRFADDIAK